MFDDPRTRWGMNIGFALGGFFDGILLHQILQWHHLLSLVPGIDSLRAQVLWDGYFHALMYVIAAAGLWGLWRNRSVGASALSGPSLLGAILVGFGLWHVVDSLLSHWLLGIHRIRVDSPDPLLWDLVWFAAFGLVPLLFGWLMLRRAALRADGLNRSTLPLIIVGLLTIGAAIWSLQPPKDVPDFTTVVFSPGISPQEAMAAVVAEGATMAWSDPAMSVLVIDVSPDTRFNFYKHGALLVSGSGLPAGCYNWSRA